MFTACNMMHDGNVTATHKFKQQIHIYQKNNKRKADKNKKFEKFKKQSSVLIYITNGIFRVAFAYNTLAVGATVAS